MNYIHKYKYIYVTTKKVRGNVSINIIYYIDNTFKFKSYKI